MNKKIRKNIISAVLAVVMSFSMTNIPLPSNVKTVEAATSKVTIKVGSTKTFSASKKVTWTISNKNILSVKSKSSKKITVYAKKAGSATVTAKAKNYKQVYKITVKKVKDEDDNGFSEYDMVSSDDSSSEPEVSYRPCPENENIENTPIYIPSKYSLKNFYDNITPRRTHAVEGNYLSSPSSFRMEDLSNVVLRPDSEWWYINLYEDGHPTKIYYTFGEILIADDDAKNNINPSMRYKYKDMVSFLKSMNFKVTFSSSNTNVFTVKMDKDGIIPIITPKKTGDGLLHMTLEADPVIKTDRYSGKYHVSYKADYPICIFYEKKAENSSENIAKLQASMRDYYYNNSGQLTNTPTREFLSIPEDDVYYFDFGLPCFNNMYLFSTNDPRTFYLNCADDTDCMSYVHEYAARFVYKDLPGYMYAGGWGLSDFENETEFHVGDRIAVYGGKGHEMMVYATEDNGHTAYLIDNGAYTDERKFKKTGDYKYLTRISMGSDEVLLPDCVRKTGIHGWDINSRILF